MSFTLREFAYIDKQIIVDFLSSIQTSLPIQTRKALTKREKKLGAKVGFPFAQVEGEKGGVETETEESGVMEEAGLFQALYAKLEENHLIKRNINEDVVPKDILEIEGRVELPVLETALNLLCDQLGPYWEAFRNQNPQAWRNLQMINRFRAISPLNLRIVPLHHQYSKSMANLSVIASLQRDKLRKPYPELADDYSIFCRVKKVLKNVETYDLLKLPVKLNDKNISELMKNFENMPSESKSIFGNSLSIENFQIGYPAIIVTPIAIYR